MAMRKYNVVAAFPDARKAERALRRLKQAGVNTGNVRVLRPGMTGDRDRVSEMRSEMQEEVAEGFAGPGIGFVTPSQAKGAAIGATLGTVVGAVVGAAIGFAWAWAGSGPIPAFGRFLIAFVPFVIAGATAGFIGGGGTRPRTDAPRNRSDAPKLVAERDTIVAIHVSDPTAAERAQHVMEELGAERVDAVNADGTPLPPQSEHPRPADPPGRWWWPGRAQG